MSVDPDRPGVVEAHRRHGRERAALGDRLRVGRVDVELVGEPQPADLERRRPSSPAEHRAFDALVDAAAGRRPGLCAESVASDPRHGHRPGRGEHGLRRRPGRRRTDDRRRRRRDRGPADAPLEQPARAHPRRAREADRLARAGARSRSRTSTSARTSARRSPSARPAASRCWPPPSAGSRASTTRRRRSRWPSAAAARRAKRQVQQMVGALLGLARPPESDHTADALAVAICHAGHAPRARARSRPRCSRPVPVG